MTVNYLKNCLGLHEKVRLQNITAKTGSIVVYCGTCFTFKNKQLASSKSFWTAIYHKIAPQSFFLTPMSV